MGAEVSTVTRICRFRKPVASCSLHVVPPGAPPGRGRTRPIPRHTRTDRPNYGWLKTSGLQGGSTIPTDIAALLGINVACCKTQNEPYIHSNKKPGSAPGETRILIPCNLLADLAWTPDQGPSSLVPGEKSVRRDVTGAAPSSFVSAPLPFACSKAFEPAAMVLTESNSASAEPSWLLQTGPRYSSGHPCSDHG